MKLLSWGAKVAYNIRGAVYRALILLSGGACGPRLRVERGLRFRHGIHRGISIGRSVYLGCGTIIDCPEGGALVIGNDVTLTHGVFISAASRVAIGDDTLIGEYVSIRDADHAIALDGGPIRSQPMIAHGIDIGPDVWIGRGVAVLSGATLERGCVIGANAVVKGTIGAGQIAVGIPARPVRARA